MGCPDRYEGCGRDWYKDIVDFHREVMLDKFSYPDKPHLPKSKYVTLRHKLVKEEMEETLEGIATGSLEKIADGIADSIVVLLGTAVTYGIDMRPIWKEVVKHNMAKKDGPVREDGKKLKPVGWKHPDIKKLLEEQSNES